MKKSLGAKTLAYPAPVWCVGSYDKDNNPNVMTAAWGGICCSMPPCITVSLRKATHTYTNIMNKLAYTVSIPSEKYVAEADYFGMVSGRDVNKFEKTGLTPVKSDEVDAPYVKEFPVILECNVIHSYEIGLHTQFIGQIMNVLADTEILSPEGTCLIRIKSDLLFSGLKFGLIMLLGRFSGLLLTWVKNLCSE